MKWLYLIYLLSASLLLSSQSFDKMLAVDDFRGKKRARFYSGDYLSISIKKQANLKGILSDLSADSVTISGIRINIGDIKRVRTSRDKAGLSILTALFLNAGFGYTALMGINGAIDDESPALSEESLWIGGSLVMAGISTALLNKQSIKIREPWQIKVIDFGR